MIMKEVMISIDQISKVYRMGDEIINALKSVTLSIHKNEYVALMGPSGSGKSTLMNILGCLDSPTAGTYVLNGIDVSLMSDGELAEVRNKQIGFVFQTFNLLPRLTSLDNVALPLVYAGYSKQQRIEKASEALHKVGLGDRMSHKPNELSGGQKQRVAIARALVCDPKVIFADEPTGNLDSKSGATVMNILERLNKEGKTIILVTHDMNVALHANRIVTIHDGEIIKDELVPTDKRVHSKAVVDI